MNVDYPPPPTPESNHFDVYSFVAATSALGPGWIRVNSGLLSCRLPPVLALTVVFYKMLAEMRFVDDVRRAAQDNFSALIGVRSRLRNVEAIMQHHSVDDDPDWFRTLGVFCNDRHTLGDERQFAGGQFLSSPDERILSADGAILRVSSKIPLRDVVKICRQYYVMAKKVAVVVDAVAALQDDESLGFARTTITVQDKHLNRIAKRHMSELARSVQNGVRVDFEMWIDNGCDGRRTIR